MCHHTVKSEDLFKLIGLFKQVFAAVLKFFSRRFSKQKHIQVCSNLTTVEVSGAET